MKQLIVLLLLSASAFAQAGAYAGSPVINGVGQPIASASVAISTLNPCGTAPTYTGCNGQAQGIYTGATPPANLAALFTDVTGAHSGPNPVLTDPLGNWTAYALPGFYWATVYGYQIVPQVQIIVIGSVGVQASPIVLANCTAAGTTLNEGVNLSTQVIAGVPTLCGTTATANSTAVVGICASACGNSGSASIAYSGYQSCVLDNQSTQNDYVVPSSNPGQCHDIGASTSSANETLGIAASTNTGAGTLATILLAPLSLILPGSTGGAGTVSSCGSGVGANAYYPGIGTVVSCDPLITDDGAGHGGMRSLALTDSTVSGNWFEVAGPALPAIASIPIHSFAFSVNPSFGTSYGLEPWDNAPVNGNCVSAVTGDATNYFKLHDTGAPCGSGAGSVTSVGLAAPTGFQISGSPVTTTGTLTLSMPTSWTTGDLLLGNGANSVARLPVGSNTFILTSNGTTAGWAAAPAGTTIQTLGVPNTSQSPLNFQAGPTVSGLTITPSNPSAGNEQMAISGALPTFSQVPQPASPTLSVGGTPGLASVSYCVEASQDTAGTQHTQCSALATATTANATLSLSPITLSGYQMATNGTSVRCFFIYRTAGGPSQGLIASCAATQFADTGVAGDGTTPCQSAACNTTVLKSHPQPLPACPAAEGAIYGIDAPACTTTADTDEGTSVFGAPADVNNPFWAWVNQNSATALWSNGEILMTAPDRGNTENLNLLCHTITASTPYTFTSAVYYTTIPTGNEVGAIVTAGLAFRESSTNKIATIGQYTQNTGHPLEVMLGKWSNSFTAATFAPEGPANSVTNPAYFQVTNDGTNVVYRYSADGIHYAQALSELKTTFFTSGPNQVCIGLSALQGAGAVDIDFVRQQ